MDLAPCSHYCCCFENSIQSTTWGTAKASELQVIICRTHCFSTPFSLMFLSLSGQLQFGCEAKLTHFPSLWSASLSLTLPATWHQTRYFLCPPWYYVVRPESSWLGLSKATHWFQSWCIARPVEFSRAIKSPSFAFAFRYSHHLFWSFQT